MRFRMVHYSVRMSESRKSNKRPRDKSESEEDVQRRLHAAARACFGKLEGTDPDLAEQARERLVSKLRRRHKG